MKYKMKEVALWAMAIFFTIVVMGAMHYLGGE